jgi:hypothetical protein
MSRMLARSLVVLALLSLAVSAEATLRYRREFVTRYAGAKGTRLDACTTCHATAPPALNPYGRAWKAAKFDFLAIEKADADSDGVANRKEIDALSFPGDRKDKPGARRDTASADSAAKDTAKVKG